MATKKTNKLKPTIIPVVVETPQEKEQALEETLKYFKMRTAQDTEQISYLDSALTSSNTAIQKIVKVIEEAFNQDGIDDININWGQKISIWTILVNISSVAKMVTKIVKIIKDHKITSTARLHIASLERNNWSFPA